jgi:hypothetical protein
MITDNVGGRRRGRGRGCRLIGVDPLWWCPSPDGCV